MIAAGFLVTLFGLLGVLSPRLRSEVDLRFWPVAVLAIMFGGTVLVLGIRGLIRSVLSVFLPHSPGEVAEVYVRNRSLLRGPRIVVLGGGTGMPILLRGLKPYTANLTAIVTSSDDGGSSGRLRTALGMPPPGDVRNCLLALAETEPLLERLFQYRFEGGEGLEGHAFGNLFLAAMERITGDFQEAIVQSSRVLAVRGRVLTATRQPVVLAAQYEDGRWVRGESLIPKVGQAVKTVRLEPDGVRTTPEVLQAIAEAEAVVLAPGSLWTSILPVLIVPGIADAIRSSRAVKIYVQNLMTQPGETEGLVAADHVRTIEAHAPGVVDWVILNRAPIAPAVLERYQRQGAKQIPGDVPSVEALGKRAMAADLLAAGAFVRHDADRLARSVLDAVLSDTAVFEPRRRFDLFLLAERLRHVEEGGG